MPCNTWWVLRQSAAVAVIALWLGVLGQVVLAVHAEGQLQRVVQEANAFARLPKVRPAELQAFVLRRLTKAGYCRARIAVMPNAATTGGPLAVRVDSPTLPGGLSVWCRKASRYVGAGPVGSKVSWPCWPAR